jgi:flagellar M-ring protein FliF
LLYGRLDDAEAAKVIGVLDELKVPHKAGAGGAIFVPREKVHLMRMNLAAKGLPRSDGVGFEVFDKPNFGISDFVQRANYIRALQGELARTIAQLDEIDAARVMIVMPENRLLLDSQKKATASVFVRTKGHVQLPPSAVNSIRFLVANSVEGLQPGQVTIVDNRGNVLSENSEPDSLAGLSAGQLAARRSLEQYLSKKAEGMLEAALGPGQAVVRVAAEINLDQVVRTEEKYDPDGQVLRSTTVNDENVESTTSGANGGPPGIASNVAADTNAAAGPSTGNKTKKKVTNSQYELNKITSNATQLAGGVKRLSAAVFVAARSEGAGASRKPLPRSKEELDKLRRIVQSAIGAQVDPDGKGRDEITLEETQFNDQLGDMVKDFGNQQKRQFWWEQVQTFAYPALAVGIVFVFLRLLKRTPVEGIPAGATQAQAEMVDASETLPQSRPASRQGRSDVLSVEVFNQLARENPDNLGQAIQTWLNRSASTPQSQNTPVKMP